MGINGLLPILKPCFRDVHIREYKGKRLAVDAYVWLHKGTFCCAQELCQGIQTEKYLSFCAKMVDMLLHFGVIPVIVFDGARLPMKSSEEHSRKSSRKENLEKARSFLQMGNFSAAKRYFQQAVDVKPAMARKFIDLLKRKNVEYIVAPYEADAQLGFLSRTGYVDGVITEDSDMIPYGVDLVLYKLKADGVAEEFHRDRLSSMNSKLSFHRFDTDKIITMCVLNGCDYLDSLPGIGIKTAHRFVSHYGNAATIFFHLRRQKRLLISKEYEEAFERAFLTFKHQRVYDPETRQMVNFTELPPEYQDQDTEFLGPYLSPKVAQQIAEGEIDPMTKEPFEKPKRVIYSHQKLKQSSIVPPNLPPQKKRQMSIPHLLSKKKKPRKPFKPPRSTSSQGSKTSQHGESSQEDSSQDRTPTSATSTNESVFSKAEHDGSSADNSIKSACSSTSLAETTQDDDDEDKHISLMLNNNRKGRLTLGRRSTSTISTSTTRIGGTSSYTRFSQRVKKSVLRSPSQEEEDAFSSDSADEVVSPPRARHWKTSLSTLPERRGTTCRSTGVLKRVPKEETVKSAAKILRSESQRSSTSFSDTESSSNEKTASKCSPRKRKRPQRQEQNDATVSRISSQPPKKKPCSSRFFSKDVQQELDPIPVRHTPAASEEPPQQTTPAPRPPPQRRVSLASLLKASPQQRNEDNIEDVSFALDPEFEEDTQTNNGSTLLRTPDSNRKQKDTPKGFPSKQKQQKLTNPTSFQRKFSSYIMEDVIHIDDDSDSDEDSISNNNNNSSGRSGGSDGHGNTSSSTSSRRTSNLFLNFLEKCKPKKQSASIKELRKKGSDVDNPIIL